MQWAQQSTHIFPKDELERRELRMRNYTPQPDNVYHDVYVFPYAQRSL